MVIGSILLQPQRLERAGQVPAADAVLDDIIGLAVRLASDGIQGGRLGETLGLSVEGTAARLETRVGAGASNAVARLGALFAPLIAPLQALTAQPPGDVHALIGDLENGLKTIVVGLQGLTPEKIRQATSTVFDILENDLGITPTFIRDLVLGVFDDMILALASAPPDETPDARANRRAVAAHLGRIKRYLQANFTFPTLSADAAAQALLTLLQRPDVKDVLTRVLCSGKGAVTYLHAGSTLVDLIPYSAFPTFGPGSVGAAAPTKREEVSFYATKLLQDDNYYGDLGRLPLSPNEILIDGVLDPSIRDAFKQASIVLARGAFLYTVDQNKEWKVVDRKKYVITKKDGDSRLWVYRLFEIGEFDFIVAANLEDKTKLRKLFQENGIPLIASKLRAKKTGDDTWDVTEDDGLQPRFVATRVKGNVTIRPTGLVADDVLFKLSAELQPRDEKTPGSPLRDAFALEVVPLTPLCRLSTREADREWLLDDGDFEYTLKKTEGHFEVSTKTFWGFVRSTLNSIIDVPKGHVVWVNRERTQVLLGQRIMHTGSNVSWQDAPIFNRINGNRYYSLRHGAATSEDWAYHTSWAQDAVNIVLHAIKIGIEADKKEKVEHYLFSHLLEGGRLSSEVIVKLGLRSPMTQLVRLGGSWWYDLSLFGLITTFKIVEAALKPSPPDSPTAGDFSKVVDKLLGVVSVEIADPHWSGILYEYILSVVTLANHEEPADASQQRPENYKESGGYLDLFRALGLLAYTALIPESEYSLPFEKASLTAGYWLGGATGVGLVTGFLGLLLGQGAGAKMNVFADGGQFVKAIGKSTGKSLLYFWPYLKLVKGKV